MATIDDNGIVFYEETDPISPIHTLLNTGQQSVSDAIGEIKAPTIITSTRTAYGPAVAPGVRLVTYKDFRSVAADNSDGKSEITYPAFTTITNIQLTLRYPGTATSPVAITVQYSDVGPASCNLVFLGLGGVSLS